MENTKYPVGSVWRKWDLHIHSPLSILNNQYPKLPNGEPDWEKFITKLESLDIAVIGITDYFTIEGYKKLLEFKKAGRLKNIETILPNIEFRLNNIVSSRKDGNSQKRLNFHVLFSDEIDPKIIQEHFLEDIDFYFEGNPNDNDDKRKLKVSELEDLGKKLLKEHRAFREKNLTPIQVGAMQAVVGHETITKILYNGARFKEKFLLVYPDDYYSLIDWDGQDHNTRKIILQKAHMVCSSNTNTREWCLGRSPYMEGEANFITEFKSLKPCIHGSDAHKIEEIGNSCIKRNKSEHICSRTEDCSPVYCWIKADPTFEGLKQLCYEPCDRVIVQRDNPNVIKSQFTLKKISISSGNVNNELSISNTELELNEGLVAITGGKGTGKTALVDLIAHCYIDRNKSEDRNSFVRRIYKEAPNLTITLHLLNGNEQPFLKRIEEKKIIEDAEIVYIAQAELENYIGDNSDLDKYINSLIFESPSIKDGCLAFKYKEVRTKVESLQKVLCDYNISIANLEKETHSEIITQLESEIKKMESELKGICYEVSEYKKNNEEKDVKEIEESQKLLTSLKEKKEKMQVLCEYIEKALDIANTKFIEFNALISLINSSLKNLYPDEKLKEHGLAEDFTNMAWDQKEQMKSCIDWIQKEIIKIIENIEKHKKTNEQHDLKLKQHAKLLERQQDFEIEKKKLEQKLEKIREKKKQLDTTISDRDKKFEELLFCIIEEQRIYKKIIKKFSSFKDHDDILSDLTFCIEVNFDFKEFLKSAEDVLDRRKVLLEEKEELFEFKNLYELLCSFLKEANIEDIDEDDDINIKNEKISKIITDISEEFKNINISLKEKIRKSKAITTQDFYHFLYTNYFQVKPTVRYKKVKLEKLSLGQKATVLIKIYLAQGNKPIIIDSHDDHLDNEFIMDELVKAIRKAKSYRQIILVSNNGNVVINSDAEQVIIASKDHEKLSYTSGAIEEPIIRQRALKILEGGKEAFKKRQEKYRIPLYEESKSS